MGLVKVCALKVLFFATVRLRLPLLYVVDRHYTGNLSRTVAKKSTFNAQTFTRCICPLMVSRLPAAPACLNTEPILKRVVPMNRTHTYIWGNRAQVEKYRSYPLNDLKDQCVRFSCNSLE